MRPSRRRTGHGRCFSVHSYSTLAESQTPAYQDPGTWHWPTAVQDPPTGPDDDEFLQAPSTASSGRKLMTDTRGDSYGSFF